MFVNPFPYTNGVEEEGKKAVSVEVTAATVRGYQGNPLVSVDDNYMKRETYEMPKMIDPGDPKKEREIWHCFPSKYEFTSDVYLNVPDGHVAYIVSTKEMADGGVTATSTLFEPGYKGLVAGILMVDGGELFLGEGQAVAELVMQKIESA
jgi:deoxycytidine triphosphate deaminase